MAFVSDPSSMENGQNFGQRNGCDTVCPGDTLIFTCTVSDTAPDGGFTVWSGTAFDCSPAEIIIPHHEFTTPVKECNDGAIVARSLRVEGNNYTSQLNVTVTSEMKGRTIECAFDDGRIVVAVVLQSTIIPFSGGDILLSTSPVDGLIMIM